MKSFICLAGMSLLAGTALATIDFFFTSSYDPYGLKNPNLAFKHSFNDGYDFNHGYELAKVGGVYAAPPQNPPDVLFELNNPGWCYIWARFNNEPPPSQVGALNGILIKINGGYTGGGIGNGYIAFYQLDNRGISPPANKKWDGDPDIFYNNPTGLIAIMASGQRNVAQDQPYNLYIGGDHRVFLLGAVKFPPSSWQMTIEVTAMNYSGTPSNPNPPPPVPRYLNKCLIPEPSALTLLALAGMMSRRR